MAEPDGAKFMIEIDGLRFSTAGRVIFDGLSLKVPRGKITAIMGPSGTGKTTLLRMVTGQLRPAAGLVVVDGCSVPELNRADLYQLRRRMGMLFQNSSCRRAAVELFGAVEAWLRAHRPGLVS